MLKNRDCFFSYLVIPYYLVIQPIDLTKNLFVEEYVTLRPLTDIPPLPLTNFQNIFYPGTQVILIPHPPFIKSWKMFQPRHL